MRRRDQRLAAPHARIFAGQRARRLPCDLPLPAARTTREAPEEVDFEGDFEGDFDSRTAFPARQRETFDAEAFEDLPTP